MVNFQGPKPGKIYRGRRIEMSLEAAKEFLEKARNDEALRNQLKGCHSEEKFFAVVEASGLQFTKEEWIAVSPKKKEGEGSSGSREEHRSPGTARWEVKGS